MNDKDIIIEQTKKRSDHFIYKSMYMISAILIVDSLFLMIINNWEITTTRILMMIGSLFICIPIFYYKKTEHKHFYVVTCISFEIMTIVLFLCCWVDAAPVLIYIFIVAILYFDTKTIKIMLWVQTPLILVMSIVEFILFEGYVIELTLQTAIITSVYYMLQIFGMGYITYFIAKESNIIFNKFLLKNSENRELLEKIILNAHETDKNISQLNNSITNCSNSVEDIGYMMNNMEENAKLMEEKVNLSKKSISTVIQDIGYSASVSENVAKFTNDMGQITKKNHDNIIEIKSHVNEIDNFNKITEVNFANLRKSNRSIYEMLEVINDVADQTNLLSLNATIEASRAGEAGKGFSVVASSIIKLSDQTNQVADDIRKILKKIDEDTEESIKSISQTSVTIESNLEMLDNAKSDFDTMFDSQNKVVDKILELKNMINKLEKQVNDIQYIFEETFSGFGKTAEEIGDISGSLKHIRHIFKDITKCAEAVRISSDKLIENVTETE